MSCTSICVKKVPYNYGITYWYGINRCIVEYSMDSSYNTRNSRIDIIIVCNRSMLYGIILHKYAYSVDFGVYLQLLLLHGALSILSQCIVNVTGQDVAGFLMSSQWMSCVVTRNRNR